MEMSDSVDIVENLRDMAYIIDESQGEAVVTMLSGSMFSEAADEIERLTQDINRLTEERNGWQAEAAGLSQDISNAEDEIERLQEEINDLRLRVVSSSIPVTGPIVLIGEDGKEYVLKRDS